ncbi:MAG: sigma-70 family RNA polymerase sigma factor [Saprospiraceae bacterium]|nr:sigma-70 family RNA polymerase sigma factor [Saprospiraceae bacterium]
MQDAEIVEKLRSGSISARNQAFHYLYHSERLRNKIRSILSPWGVEHEQLHELIQYAMIVLDRKIREADFTLTSSVETYFCSIVKNKYLYERQDSLKKRKIMEISEATEVETAETPFADLDDEKVKTLLWSIVEKMNERCKALLPRWALGTNGDELCREFGFSTPEQAKKETYRCRQKLKEYVNDTPGLKTSLLNLLK